MKKTIFWSLVIAVLAVSLSGCIDNDRSLAIMWVLQPDPSSDCEVSTVSGDDQQGALFGGSLDIAHPGFGGEPTYYMNIQVHNNLAAEAAVCETCEINNHDIQLERIEVRYSFEKGRESIPAGSNLLLLEQEAESLPVAGSLEAGSINLVMGIPVVSRLVGGGYLYNLGELADEVVLGINMRIIGTTLGGERVESNEFLFPVYLCWGCLSETLCPDGTYPGCYVGQEPAPGACEDE